MRIHAIATHKITATDQNLFAILDTYVSAFDERAVLAITSKIVSICQGRVVKLGTVEKRTLIEQEADYFLPAALHKYHTTLTITQGVLIPAAGIDEPNGDGYYVLWPRDPQQTANAVRAYLQRRFSRTHVGVIITDSKTTPLRVGVTGVALAYSGFQALNDEEPLITEAERATFDPDSFSSGSWHCQGNQAEGSFIDIKPADLDAAGAFTVPAQAKKVGKILGAALFSES